jgi:predicted outer membrane repeat protein
MQKKTFACALLAFAFMTTTHAETWVTVRASTPEQIFRALETASATRKPTTILITRGFYSFPRAIETGRGRGVLPAVTSTVFIVGDGRADETVLDAAGRGRVLTVLAGGTLVARNISVINGGFEVNDDEAFGGGAANFGGNLRFDDCVIAQNDLVTPRGSVGGGIISTGRLHLERTTVMRNIAGTAGGGIAASGRTIIRDSIIMHNETMGRFFGRLGGGIEASGTMTITGSTISSNRTLGEGAGIFNRGELWITDSAITHNEVTRLELTSAGGGISNRGILRLKNVTVAANSSGTYGGGIYNAGLLVLRGATIARNVLTGELNDIDPPQGLDCIPGEMGACLGGGGIWTAASGTTTSARSVIAENVMPLPSPRIPAVGPDCNGQIQSEGFNALRNAINCQFRPSYKLAGRPAHDLINVDPRLGDLQSTLEPGSGHIPLLAGSPLIDADGGVSDICTARDQLGQRRVDADRDGQQECDIGAIEFQKP